jgi:hypothetical protein
MSLKVTLESIENGFLVTQKDITDDGHTVFHKEAFTYDGQDDSDEACKAMQRALYSCMDRVGWVNNKYSPYTVQIEISEGHKFEVGAEN